MGLGDIKFEGDKVLIGMLVIYFITGRLLPEIITNIISAFKIPFGG